MTAPRGLAALAALTFVAAAGCKRGHRATVDQAMLPPAPGEKTVFALRARTDQALTFPIETTRTMAPAGRRLRLLVGGGAEATLTLLDPETPDENDVAFGHGELSATDRTRGAAFVAAIAQWLGRAPAAARPVGALRSAAITYARMGTEGFWESNKLFFNEGELSAELYLNVRLDGKEARFVEKDEAYREPLLTLLGASPRR